MKAIYIDGASLWHMQEMMLGSGSRFNLCELYQILVEEIGTEIKLAFEPVVTIPDSGASWAKSLRSAGFKLLHAPSSGHRDDRAIIASIEQLDKTVTEIVIVSADQDYVAALRKHGRRKVKIYWVATRMLERGRLTIGATLEQLFELNEFTFVELAKYIQRLQSDRDTFADLKLVIEVRGTLAQDPVIAEVERMMRQYPGMSYKIKRAGSNIPL